MVDSLCQRSSFKDLQPQESLDFYVGVRIKEIKEFKY